MSGQVSLESFVSSFRCYYCNKAPKEEKNLCGRCREAIYCGKGCQTSHWPFHKIVCKSENKPVAQVAKGVLNPEKKEGEFSLKESPFLAFATQKNTALRESLQTMEDQVFLKNQRKVAQDFRKFHSPSYDHIANTQKFILEGISHLNPDSSIVIVCGAQFTNRKFVEPLPELLKACAKLILIDVDPVTLNLLKEKLFSPKVVTKTLDLSGTLDLLVQFEKDVNDNKPTKVKFVDKAFNLLNCILARLKEMPAGLSDILAEGEKADYVISSLVILQLFIAAGRIELIFEKMYKSDFKKYLDNKSKLMPYLLLEFEITKMMVDKHIEDLNILSGNQGMLYVSETLVNNGNPAVDRDIEEDLKKTLRRYRTSFQEQHWHWYIPNVKVDYEVSAFLVHNKKEK